MKRQHNKWEKNSCMLCIGEGMTINMWKVTIIKNQTAGFKNWTKDQRRHFSLLKKTKKKKNNHVILFLRGVCVGMQLSNFWRLKVEWRLPGWQQWDWGAGVSRVKIKSSCLDGGETGTTLWVNVTELCALEMAKLTSAVYFSPRTNG